MNIKTSIANTNHYKELTKKTPFLKTMLLKKNTTEEIERIIYQIEKLGKNYIQDKGYSDREVKIALEIIESKKNQNGTN
jgi:hypothetical protein